MRDRAAEVSALQRLIDRISRSPRRAAPGDRPTGHQPPAPRVHGVPAAAAAVSPSLPSAIAATGPAGVTAIIASSRAQAGSSPDEHETVDHHCLG